MRRTPVRSPLRKCFGEETESAAIGFVREQSLILVCSSDDGCGWKGCCTGRERVHSPKALLDAFEGSRHRCRSKVDHVCVTDYLRHETQLVDVEVTDALPKCEGRFASFVGEFT